MRMTRSVRRSRRLGTALLLVVALAAAGCGSGGNSGETSQEEADESTTSESSSEEESATGGGEGDLPGGAPIGRAPGGVVGSPIRMPAIEQAGQPPSALQAFLEPLIREECGGALCVTVSYVDQDGRPIAESDPRFTAEGPDDPEICRFSRERSGATADREVDRGDVVTLVFVCTPSDVEDEGTGGTNGDGEGGDGETDAEGSDAPSGEVTTEALSSAKLRMGTLEP